MRHCSNCSEMIRDKDWDSHACLPRTPAAQHDTPERIWVRSARWAERIKEDGPFTGMGTTSPHHVGTEYVRADLARPAPSDDARALREAAQAVVDNAFHTYKARNGRQCTIEADDGEACLIVHSDFMHELRAALAAPTPEEPADAR